MGSMAASGPRRRADLRAHGSVSVSQTDARLHDVQVVMTRGRPKGAIRIRVRDDEDKTPSSVFLSVENVSGSRYAGWYARRIDLDAPGRIDVPGVVPGNYDVSVAGGPTFSVEGFWPPAHAAVHVDADRATDVVLTLAVGGRVRVVVKDESGTIVVPARLDLLSEAGERLPLRFLCVTKDGGCTTELDASPAILGQPVAPGHYVVAATGPAGDVVKKDVDIPRGATVDVELTVRAKK